MYSMLGNLLELDGFFLESEPCRICSDPDVPMQVMKLDSAIRAEGKFWRRGLSPSYVAHLRCPA